MIKLKTAQILFLTVMSIVSLTGCDDKININADYTTTPIIFGLLDHSESVHLIKITKTFLGEGNNFDFAKVPDSSYFRSVDATVIELNGDQPTGRKWKLKDSILTTKEDGTFYNPEQKVYVFYEDNLNESFNYKLEATMNEGQYSAEATTSLIDGFSYDQFFLQTPELSFASGNGNRLVLGIRYREGLNGEGYQTKLTINYKETYLDNTSAIKSIVWAASENNGISETINPDNPKNRSVAFRGEDFYNTIAARLDEDDNVLNRQIIDIDVVTEVGHKDLMKYIEVGKPTTSISQNTPSFTNVTGGLGLFSSRLLAKRNGIGVSPPTIEALCTSEPTNVYKFCSTLPSHIGEFFYCF